MVVKHSLGQCKIRYLCCLNQFLLKSFFGIFDIIELEKYINILRMNIVKRKMNKTQYENRRIVVSTDRQPS